MKTTTKRVTVAAAAFGISLALFYLSGNPFEHGETSAMWAVFTLCVAWIVAAFPFKD